MHITIFGSGYVGLVTAACLADVGNRVLCVDIDEDKVARLKNGDVPIYEPGLDELIQAARKGGRIDFTTDVAQAVAHAELQMIAVGTPPDEDGSADLSHVLAVSRSIARHMTEPKIIIVKSTVPVGTGDLVERTISEQLKQNGREVDFEVVSNPEFLKEGAAIEDFMKPDRIIVGADGPRATALLKELYAPFSRQREKIIVMDRRSAELTKYAANAMLATRISFMNEIATIAEKVGADIESIRIGLGTDPRIGPAFLYAGAGFGGSCFPKDVRALVHSARQVGVTPDLLLATLSRNDKQKRVLFEKLRRYFDGQLRGRTIAVWGLAFKPGTDDMREAPSRTLMEALWEAGATVRAHDPVAMEECRRIYGHREDLVLCATPEEALDGADALVLVTEWKVFRSLDYDLLHQKMRYPVVFDGRNLYDPHVLASHGIAHFGIGRPHVPPHESGESA